jgi:hypothetical protein
MAVALMMAPRGGGARGAVTGLHRSGVAEIVGARPQQEGACATVGCGVQDEEEGRLFFVGGGG